MGELCLRLQLKTQILFTVLLICQFFVQGQNLDSSFYSNKTYYKSGILSSEYYLRYNDKGQQIWHIKSYYHNGKLEFEKDVLNDSIEYNFTHYSYYKTGTIKNKLLRPKESLKGTKDFHSAYSIDYFKNGNIKKEGLTLTKLGQMGQWKFYFKNGNIKRNEYWNFFKKVGVWEFYDSKGKLIKKRHMGPPSCGDF